MSEKGKCFLAYLFGWIGGLIVLFGMKENERNTKFHAAQSIVLSALYCGIMIIFNFIPFGGSLVRTVLGVVYIVGIIAGIVKANNGENPELPIIGEITKSIFSSQIGE